MRRRRPKTTSTDTLFPYTTLFRYITKQCTKIKQTGGSDWDIVKEGRRLIKADICSRMVFLHWFMDTFHSQPDICNPEQFLLLQLHGGQALMLQLFERSEEHTSELQSLMRTSYAVFCLKKKKY